MKERRSTGHAVVLRLPGPVSSRLEALSTKVGVSKTTLCMLSVAAMLEGGEATLTDLARKSKAAKA